MSAIQQLLTDYIDIWTAAETEKKSGRGRASGSAAGVYGIRKMRELILELAVRGKLVPQDDKDEPASELLKRIQIEKGKLLEEGKIKKGKLLDQDVAEELPFTLPTGWSCSRLGNVVDIVRGITFPGSEKTKVPADGRVACLRTSNVQDQIEWHDLLYIREEFVSRDDQILMPRDIVMSMANSMELVGKVALVGSTINQKTSFGGFLGVLRPYLIEPRFVMALLRTPYTRAALIDSASQTTNIANISLAKLRPLFFAIPPLAEQQRIVAKVDELMTLCGQLEAQSSDAVDAHEQLVSHLLSTLTQSQCTAEFNANWQRIAAHFDTLFTTETSIDALKQTLLQLAVTGKLVDSNCGVATVDASGLSHGVPRLKPKFSNLPDFPRHWSVKSLSEVSEAVVDCPHSTPKWSNEGVICIRTSQFKPGQLDLNDVRYVSEEIYQERVQRLPPREDDILYSREGGILGVACRVPKEVRLCLGQRMMLIRPGPDISPLFLEMLLNSPMITSIARNMTTGGAAPRVNVSTVKNYPILLPPLEEQHRIIAKIRELTVICDQIKACINEVDQLQKRLADVLVEHVIA
jgi:type I restriction enzyme S subunit